MQHLFQNLTSTIDNKPQKPEEAALTHETDTNLLQAVYQLNDKHRIPIILRYYHACSILEIAQILKVPEGTIHSRLNTARRRLKIHLQTVEERQE